MPSATITVDWEWDHDTPAVRIILEGHLDNFMDELIENNVVDPSISTTFDD